MRKLTIIILALVIAAVAGSGASASSITVKAFKARYYVMPKDGVAIGVGSKDPYLLNGFFASASKPWRALFRGYTSSTPPDYVMRCAWKWTGSGTWTGHYVLIALYANSPSVGDVICTKAAKGPFSGRGWTRIKLGPL